ncbi:TPA: DMT family transporter [Candidatus Poribacteria bacterium]|nr:DMT family transporter [Candidatus Poribacteria bacterium]HIB89343.1 DMT family transporter [Candidatus Poribacteria bacterium]HIC16652.1 DMT family transporter [Candidatus Poribacteria bacterium]HIM10902.1 DMT family transporter [Candidatus Poribacteria bacterium]HIO50870.1 DMT family transporter [Candidatus Poribacteria bacterium]
MATDLFGLKLLSSLSYMTKQTHLQIPKHVILLILFLAALWGGNTPAVKFGLQEFQPIAAAAIRFALGIVVIISWAVIKRIPLRPKQENYGRLLLLGTVFVAQIISFNWGTKLTEVGRASLLLNTYPLFIALLAHFFIQHDRLTVVKTIGLLVAFAGVCFIFYGKPGTNLSTAYLGDLIILFSGFLLAMIHILLKRFMSRMHQFQLLFGQMVVGIPAYFVLSWFFEGGTAAYGFSYSSLLGLVYQGIVVAGFCFIVWVSVLKRYPPSRLSSLFFTTPLWSVLFGYFFFHEPITILLLVGATFVAAGVYLVNRPVMEEQNPN